MSKRRHHEPQHAGDLASLAQFSDPVLAGAFKTKSIHDHNPTLGNGTHICKHSRMFVIYWPACKGFKIAPSCSWCRIVLSELMPTRLYSPNSDSLHGQSTVSCKYAIWPCTLELSPPEPGSPQVTTDPSAKIAAKSSTSGLNLLDILELSLDFRAVTTTSSVVPGDRRPIFQDCSKSARCSLNLLPILELSLDLSAVATKFWMSACSNRSICQDCWTGSAAHFVAGLGLQNYHHLCLDCPR